MKIDKLKIENSTSARPKLLLHACCAPCSTAVYEKLCKRFDLTVFWYNPNIYPEQEHDKRLDELKKLAKLLSFELIIDQASKKDHDKWLRYSPEQFNNLTIEQLSAEPEGGKRCHFCYAFRLNRAAKYASENNFDFFATTLTVSPHKNTPKILGIGKQIEEQASKGMDPGSPTPSNSPSGMGRTAQATIWDDQMEVPDGGYDIIGLKFLAEDFKKAGGYQRSIEISKKYGLYRQSYCGCKYSIK